jgi:hypothetical protein
VYCDPLEVCSLLASIFTLPLSLSPDESYLCSEDLELLKPATAILASLGAQEAKNLMKDTPKVLQAMITCMKLTKPGTDEHRNVACVLLTLAEHSASCREAGGLVTGLMVLSGDVVVAGGGGEDTNTKCAPESNGILVSRLLQFLAENNNRLLQVLYIIHYTHYTHTLYSTGFCRYCTLYCTLTTTGFCRLPPQWRTSYMPSWRGWGIQRGTICLAAAKVSYSYLL